MEIQYSYVTAVDGYVAKNADNTVGYASGVYDTVEEMMEDMILQIESIYEEDHDIIPTCHFTEVEPSVVWE